MSFSDPALTPAHCPNCGEPTAAHPAVRAARPCGPIGRYFHNVWRVLTRPSAFFRDLPVTGGVSGPLAFALITHWIGSAASFLWHLSIGGLLGGYFERFVRMAGDVAEVDNPGRNAQLLQFTERVKDWFFGAGSVIADPFTTLAQILFTSFLVFAGARILVAPGGGPGRESAPREITFESALRVVCYGMTPAILAVLPLFGGFIGYMYVAVVSIIGAREVYRIDNLRATLVALFPQVLLFSFVILILFAMTLAAIKFFTMGF